MPDTSPLAGSYQEKEASRRTSGVTCVGADRPWIGEHHPKTAGGRRSGSKGEGGPLGTWRPPPRLARAVRAFAGEGELLAGVGAYGG